MARIETHKEFLETFCNISDKKVKIIIKNCSEDQVKTLVELFLNLDRFIETREDKKKINKFRKVISSLLAKKLSLLAIKRFLYKNSKLVSIIVVTFLTKFVEGILCATLNYE